SIVASRRSRVTMGARPQPQPVLDEDVGQDVGDQPQDHQQRRRTSDIGVLEEFALGLDLEHHQAVAGPALRHRVDDVEL
ncbi:hypothetical protein NQ420_27845, partial [Escherichia coli]|nr:hypothetical protein [Escherichia coli]